MRADRSRWVLALIIAVGLLRGLWWVAVTPLWSPIDEQAHFDYVESIARGDGIPIVGKTQVHPDVLTLVPHPSSVIRQSYEAAQPPLYYAAMAPLWRAFHSARTRTTVYALRVASLLVSLLLIPLVYLIARELLPDEAHIGVLAAALVAVWSGPNGNFAIVANDGLMAVLAAATLLVTARAIRLGLSSRRAVVTGVLVGATVLTKTTGLAIVAVVAVGALIAARLHRARITEIVRFGMIAGGIAALLVAPWLVFNHAHYGALTAAKQLDAITGPLQTNPPWNLHGFVVRLRQGAHGFFDAQLLSPYPTRGSWLWFGATAVIGLVAGLQLVRRRQGRDLAVLAWLLSTWPIAFLTMVVFILHLSGGRSDVNGRHLYVALPALAVAFAFAAERAFGRAARVVVALVVAVGLTLEASDAVRLMHLVYGPTLRGLQRAWVPDAWAAIGWVGVAAAFSITRWGKPEVGRRD